MWVLSSPMNTNPLPERRGRRRSDAADRAILDAALRVLAVDGYGNFTMGAVIAQAGTSSATLYRRWQTKNELVGAALATLSPRIPTFDTATLQGDLAAFIEYFAEGKCVDADALDDGLVDELGRDPEFHQEITDKFVAPRISALVSILERAERRGEIGAGIGGATAYSVVIGPVHHHVHVLGKAADKGFLGSATTAAHAALTALADG